MEYLPDIDCEIPSIDLLSLLFGALTSSPISQLQLYAD